MRDAKPYLAADPGIMLWSCANLLSAAEATAQYAMVIVNQPITRKDVFLRAWDSCESAVL